MVKWILNVCARWYIRGTVRTRGVRVTIGVRQSCSDLGRSSQPDQMCRDFTPSLCNNRLPAFLSIFTSILYTMGVTLPFIDNFTTLLEINSWVIRLFGILRSGASDSCCDGILWLIASCCGTLGLALIGVDIAPVVAPRLAAVVVVVVVGLAILLSCRLWMTFAFLLLFLLFFVGSLQTRHIMVSNRPEEADREAMAVSEDLAVHITLSSLRSFYCSCKLSDIGNPRVGRLAKYCTPLSRTAIWIALSAMFTCFFFIWWYL